MPLHMPDGSLVAPEYQDLARKLHDGDGILWTGDPALFLGVGVMKEMADGRPTGRTGRRLEVWRANEDGSDALVGHWHPSEQHRVCYDLAQMRLEAPGHQDTLDRIDKHNDAVQEAADTVAREAMFETLEHATALHVEREHGKRMHFLEDLSAPATPHTETSTKAPLPEMSPAPDPVVPAGSDRFA